MTVTNTTDCNLTRKFTSIDDSVVADQVAHCAQGVVHTAFGFINDHFSSTP